MRLVFLAAIAMATSHRAPAADIRDALDFPAPHSRCMHAAKGRILTSVGTFPAESDTKFEVVADTRLDPQPAHLTRFEDPSINIFDHGCELVWRRSYPSLSEVGFSRLDLPGRTMLHVSAISIFEPVDQVISDQDLLSSGGDSMSSELSFGGDRYDDACVGRMGRHGAFAVLIVNRSLPPRIIAPMPPPTITGLLYRWTTFADPDDPTNPGHLFVGPQRLDAGQVAALKLPAEANPPLFPLKTFVFGYAGPG